MKPMFCGAINSIFPCALFTVIGFSEIRMTSVHNVGHVLFVTKYNVYFSEVNFRHTMYFVCVPEHGSCRSEACIFFTLQLNFISWHSLKVLMSGLKQALQLLRMFCDTLQS